MTKKTISDYLLRNIPADVKKKAQYKAIELNCTLREIILQALESFCK